METHRQPSLSDLQVRGDYVALPDRGIVMICPSCGNWFELGGPHCYPHQIVQIEPLSVTPSVICPWKGCHFVVSRGTC